MQFDNKITRSVAEAVSKVMNEKLHPNQQKLDVHEPEKDKLTADDFKKLRSMKKEETEQVQEGWDDMMKAVAKRAGPQPSGGAGMKQGTRYGGGKQTSKPEQEPEATEKPAKKKKKLSEMVASYKEAGLKSIAEMTKKINEEPDNEQYTKELEDQKASMMGKKKQPAVAAPATQGVKTMPEETEIQVFDADKINGTTVETIGERALTPSETEKKEDIVKGMKKGLQGFKDRYGDRAKEVMYATATKNAKKD